MIKYLVVIGVIASIYYFFIRKKSANISDSNNNKKDTLESNDMVECTSCGIYSEINDSILSSGKFYCSDECVKKGKS